MLLNRYMVQCNEVSGNLEGKTRIFRGYFALPQHSVYLRRVLALLAWDEYNTVTAMQIET